MVDYVVNMRRRGQIEQRECEVAGASGADQSVSRVAHLAPFVAAAVLGFILIAASIESATAYVIAFALAVGVLLMTFGLPWNRLPTSFQVAPALVFLLAAAFLREAGGGNTAGVGILALLPVFWIALHGTRGQLAVVLAGVAAFFLAPIMIVGGTAYPTSGYRGAIMFVAIGSIVGLTVQRLVEQVRKNADELERQGRDLEHVAAVSRRVATSPDPRTEVCVAACELSRARFAVLLEPQGGDRLVSTAMSGLESAPFGAAPADRRSAPTIAMTSRRPVFIREADGHPALNPALWREHGSPASMLFEPVLRTGSPVGVLIVGWDETVEDRRRAAIVSLLATEAAIAIERADLVERLSDLALTDSLTGVPNRRALDESLATALRAAALAHDSLCVAMLDLDHFKAYNDANGHQSGDRLLKEAVAAWRRVLRPGDVLARYGGEEFAVVLPGCSRDAAIHVLERLRGATPGHETCSAGVAAWDGFESADDLLGRADAALYEAKSAGRNRTVAAAV